MNKKARVIHFVNFAILVIIVIVLISQPPPTLKVKGSWQTDLLQKTHLEAQKDLLKQDITAKGIGRYVAKQLAVNSGFFPNVESPCGNTSNNIHQWNKLEQECFPDYKTNSVTLSESILKNKFPKRSFKNIQYVDTLFTAKGNKENINIEKARYFYDTSFAVDIGYDFIEYENLKDKARNLLTSCRNKRDLVPCIKKPVLWNYGSCENEQQLDPQNRLVEFCVEGISNRVPLDYIFALDFTPTTPFEVENTLVSYNQDTNTYEITFDNDEFADGYNIYFTNAINLASYQGKVEGIYILEAAAEFLEKISINKNELITDQNKCNNKEKSKAYLCEDKITYILQNQLLIEGEDYLFATTTHAMNQESTINGFFLADNIASTT